LAVQPSGETYVFRSRKGENLLITRGQAHHIMKTLAFTTGMDATRVGRLSTRKA
jgi:hypothetical protein